MQFANDRRISWFLVFARFQFQCRFSFNDAIFKLWCTGICGTGPGQKIAGLSRPLPIPVQHSLKIASLNENLHRNWNLAKTENHEILRSFAKFTRGLIFIDFWYRKYFFHQYIIRLSNNGWDTCIWTSES